VDVTAPYLLCGTVAGVFFGHFETEEGGRCDYFCSLCSGLRCERIDGMMHWFLEYELT